MKISFKLGSALLMFAAVTLFSGCEDSKSYADLLNDETKSINAFLADQRVVSTVPDDSVFVTRYELAEKMLRDNNISTTDPQYDKKFSEALDEMIKDPAIDAPFYRMDEDGDVYMRVVKTGDMENRPEFNDLVYVRLTRYNLQDYDGILPEGYGNAYDVATAITIRYDNENSQSYTQWGEGIQLPLDYLGYGSEVEIVVRSRKGPNDEIGIVIPYLYVIRYFKSNI
ncbi:DUF4827 family protein [uncultured Muribaculum sp.]|uniref:DUF4827 family protein n=1 Tax=uncultured Muribaculum sp. TaxID=1918613 RepID=UPI002599638E|nr:DUF4827 family protein [uncultured Muribaculum sp.]